MAYWLQQPYLGIGINATSYLPFDLLPASLRATPLPPSDGQPVGLRFQTTNQWKQRQDDPFPYTPVEWVTNSLHRLEHCLLGLRTDRGVQQFSTYADLLVTDWETQVAELVAQEFCQYIDDHLVLTPLGMNVYNTIITNLLTATARESQKQS